MIQLKLSPRMQNDQSLFFVFILKSYRQQRKINLPLLEGSTKPKKKKN